MSLTDKALYHVTYGGDHTNDSLSVCNSVGEALERYDWFRVVEADGEIEAIQTANDESGTEVSYGEVYFVTPFIPKPTEKVEVIVTV